MAKKQNIKLAASQKPPIKVNVQKPPQPKSSSKPRSQLWSRLAPYLPGILLFVVFLVVGLFTFKDYGICWDEPYQRAPGLLSYDYIFNGSQELFKTATDNHGAGYELLLVIFEKMLGLTDSRDIYLMRHIVTNLLFISGAFAAYVLVFRLFKDRFVASLGFLMMVLAPRLYAHSFFNSKDIPFLSMITIAFACSQIAFEKNKPRLFFILGLAVGYATSIRIMGVMLGSIILFFLALDLVTDLVKKEPAKRQLLNILFYSVGFCLALYLGWPYLWRHPIQNFLESFSALAHYALWKGSVLMSGEFIPASKLPWTYFPTWFLISNPEIWLIAGFAGIVWFLIDFIRKPMTFLKNTNERQFLVYIACFFGPIMAVIFMHSIIYDDWRHLYFVYPPFVLMAVYFVNKMLHTRFKLAMQVVCILQAAVISVVMIINHPFNQVYFNYLVSHKKEYLRKNFDLEYWGSSYKQALEYLITSIPSGPILVNSETQVLLTNNMLILPQEDRARIQVVEPEKADYFVTNYRNHPYDYAGDKPVYSKSVFNSTVLAVFKEEKDPVKQKQVRAQSIADLSKSLVHSPDDCYLHAQLGDVYFRDGQFDSAAHHHMRALQLNAASVAINELAGEYFGKQRYRDAIDLCQKAVEMNPADVNTLTNIGLVYMRISKFDSAIYTLHKAIAIDPNYMRAYINLGLTFKAMGNTDSSNKYDAIAQKIQAGEKP
jgi:tetratricopeptide (TPR) repeat protein